MPSMRERAIRPSYITNSTWRSAEICLRGFPATAMRSANFPVSKVPTFRSIPQRNHSRQAVTVADLEPADRRRALFIIRASVLGAIQIATRRVKRVYEYCRVFR